MPRGRLVVVGGGPAGFFCAVNAALMNPSLEVIIVEGGAAVLSKLKASGGGRCNLTHACFDISEMAGRYPRGRNFVRKAFHRFFTTDTVRWFEERGVKIKREDDGRMFPETDSSQTVVDCLLREANRQRVEVLKRREVKRLHRSKGGWLVEFKAAQSMEADFVCVACGGCPERGLAWLEELGHTIVEPAPSLFTFNIPGSDITSLMGVSVQDVSVRIVGSRFQERGSVLVTHWGLSGPAILGLSAWAAREAAAMRYHFTIRVNWAPALKEDGVRERLQAWRIEKPGRKIRNGNPFALPQRLWEYELHRSGIDPDLRRGDLPAKERNRLIRNLSAQEFMVKGRTANREEFVTAGGVTLSEVDVNTMMSKRQPNLFFAGEILDVDGLTGGYNLQHAWTSGFIAATGVCRDR